MATTGLQNASAMHDILPSPNDSVRESTGTFATTSAHAPLARHSRIVVDLERESKAIAEFFVESFPEFRELLERILTQERADGVATHNGPHAIHRARGSTGFVHWPATSRPAA